MTVLRATWACSRVPTKLGERCAVLGLFCWHADDAGAVVAEPDAPAELGAWLGSPWVRAHVDAAAKTRPGGDPVPMEVFAGCWSIALVERQGSRCLGATLAMVLSPSAVARPEFAEACTSAGLDPSAVSRGLATWLAGRSPDPVQAAAVLRWSLEDLSRVRADAVTLDLFSEKLIQSYEETNLLFRLARCMNGVDDPEQVIRTICGQMRQALPFQWVGIWFGREGRGVSDLANRFLLAGELPCPAQDLEHQLALLVERMAEDDWTRVLTPAESALARMVGAEVVAEPIAHDGRTIGVLAAGNKGGPDPGVSSVEMQFLDAAADFLGVFHENLARFVEQRDLFLGTLHALTAAIDAKDSYTCGHSDRVALLASRMAGALGLGRQEVEQYRIAGMVHDVGKIGIAEAILCKAGRLTDEEFAHIRRHSEIGHRILKDIPQMAPQLPGVLHHHERWDGRGYPHGLAGAAIPLIARVIALADTFDAMSSSRSYRPALPRARVRAEIERCAGAQFDPALASVFLKLDLSDFDRMLAGRPTQAGSAA